MATIVWTEKAKVARKTLYVHGVINFGYITALKITHRIESITDKLERFPGLGYREPILEGRAHAYRACHINKRFKIIYWYDEMKDMVVIEDIWDMLRAPKNLMTRIIS